MQEIDLIVDLHKNSERQGPGSAEETLKALALTGLSKQQNIKVADIGCGSGGPTLSLAQNINGHLTAIDLFPDFLKVLDQRAHKLGLGEKISTLEHSMEDLPFAKNSFDLLWSEGAIYNIGFETGIKKWRDYLKPNAYLAVSEITWISNARPKEIEDYWLAVYPEIDVASNKISLLEQNGYTLKGYFYLNENSWSENYFQPLQAQFSAFLARNNHSELAQKIVLEQEEEISLYQKFKAYFSYGFYIAKKN